MWCLVAPILLLVVALAAALMALFEVQRDADAYLRGEQAVVTHAARMGAHAAAAGMGLRDLLMDPSSKAPLGRMQEAREGFESSLASSEVASAGKALASRVATLRKASADWMKAQDAVVAMRESDPAMAIVTLNAEESAAYQRVRGELAEWTLEAEAGAAAAREMTQRQTGRALIVVSVVTGLALVIAAGLGLLMRRLLDRELGGEPAHARSALDCIAGGDLTVELPKDVPVTSLMGTVASMRESLAGLVQEVRGVSLSVTSASGEISSGSQDLSARTERAAGSLQASVQIMAGLAQDARESATNAVEAQTLGGAAETSASRCEVAMVQARESMEKIRSASKRIADITTVIDGLAAQTNILALNAAVEASRAGEQGKGFAVVAAEVRELAQRAAGASQDIHRLVQGSTVDIQSGSGHVSAAAERMSEAVASIRRISVVSDEIVASAAAQERRIQQVAEMLEHLDAATQQNAALSEESAAASESLSQQAERLTALMQRFRLNVGAQA
jgi:methyl-accepting chemotaxis protein